MKNLLAKLTIIAVALVVSSCGKDDDSATSKTNREKLVGYGWIIQTSVIDPKVDFGNGPTSDGLTLVEPCDKDNVEYYVANSSYLKAEGATKCDQWASETADKGTWELNADETKLTLNTDAFGLREIEIISISETQLVLKGTTTFGGNNHTYQNTYVKTN